MYFSIIGAIITIVLNLVMIPKIGFMASAWATLTAYGVMMLLSYFIGKKHYPVPYNIKKTISNNSSNKFFHNKNYSFTMKENDFFFSGRRSGPFISLSGPRQDKLDHLLHGHGKKKESNSSNSYPSILSLLVPKSLWGYILYLILFGINILLISFIICICIIDKSNLVL